MTEIKKSYDIELQAYIPGIDADFNKEIAYYSTLEKAVKFAMAELTRGIGYPIRQFRGETWVSIYDDSEIVFIYLNGKIIFSQNPTCSVCRYFSDSGIQGARGYCTSPAWFRTATGAESEACPLFEERPQIPAKIAENEAGTLIFSLSHVE